MSIAYDFTISMILMPYPWGIEEKPLRFEVGGI
jgi:hypothetical protein